MKKFYVLLMVVFVAVTAFAQPPKGSCAKERPALLPTLRVPVIHSLPTLTQPVLFQKSPTTIPMLQRAKKAAPEVSENYVRVSTTPKEWEGQYLIVYEEGFVAMNGSLTEKLDVTNNTVKVAIRNQEIPGTEEMDAVSFTITKTEKGYAIKGQGGLYMGWATQGSNGLLSSKETMYAHKLNIDNEGNADIYALGGDAYLRYNAASDQQRFRFYKSKNYQEQQPVALYKKGGEKTELNVPDVVTLPEGLQAEPYAMFAMGYVVGENGWASKERNKTVQVAFDGSDVYISGLSYWLPEAFVKGTLQGSQILIPNTYMGQDSEGNDNYLIPCSFNDSGEEIKIECLFLDFDAETRVIQMNPMYRYAEGGDATASLGYFDYWDTLTLTPGEAVIPEVVKLPEGIEAEPYVLTALAIVGYDNEGNPETEIVKRTASVAFDGNDVYFQGFCEFLPKAWVKASKDNDVVVVPSGQYLGAYAEMFDLYLLGYNSETGVGDITFHLSEGGVMSTEDYLQVCDVPEEPEAVYMVWYGAVLTPGEIEKPETVELPEGLTAVSYVLTGKSLGNDREGNEVYNPVATAVKVAFDEAGNEVYIQGFCKYLPEAWVKGTLDNNVVTVPTGQYFGSYRGLVDLYFIGTNDSWEDVCDITFTLSRDRRTLSTKDWLLTSGGTTIEDVYTAWLDVTLTKPEDKAAMPAAPSIVHFEEWEAVYGYGWVELYVPIVDVEGDTLLVDKLSYKLYVDEAGKVSEYKFTTALYEELKENMIEVPFTFDENWDFRQDGTTIYVSLNSPTATYDRMGVQTIYRGGNVVNRTEISWFDIRRNAIRDIEEADRASYDVLYNLSGQRVGHAAKGIYIRNGRKIVVK